MARVNQGIKIMKFLFVGKKDDQYAMQASQKLLHKFPESKIIFLSRADKIPGELGEWSGDYLLSYLCPLVIPTHLLEKASRGTINWHPGTPDYPGIGCTNFAIYHQEKIFGMTCHYMEKKVDSGKIIEVRRFPIHKDDTVESITYKCYELIFESFNSIINSLSQHNDLPKSQESWSRLPYTRKELDQLCEITFDMSQEEMEKRIKATTFKSPWAFVVLNGRKFYLK